MSLPCAFLPTTSVAHPWQNVPDEEGRISGRPANRDLQASKGIERESSNSTRQPGHARRRQYGRRCRRWRIPRTKAPSGAARLRRITGHRRTGPQTMNSAPRIRPGPRGIRARHDTHGADAPPRRYSAGPRRQRRAALRSPYDTHEPHPPPSIPGMGPLRIQGWEHGCSVLRVAVSLPPIDWPTKLQRQSHRRPTLIPGSTIAPCPVNVRRPPQTSTSTNK